MAESEFLRQREAAINRMREYSAKSKTPGSAQHNATPKPEFKEKSNYDNKPQPQKPINNSGFNIPILDNILKDGDLSLILGLMLVLMSENADKMLLFALVYILM